jgi:hypothetical protein
VILFVVKKGFLLSTTHVVYMKDLDNIFSFHYFCCFSFPSFSTEVCGDAEQDNPTKRNLCKFKIFNAVHRYSPLTIYFVRSSLPFLVYEYYTCM